MALILILLCTDVVLNFYLVWPLKWKIGLISCFLNRAWNICSSYKLFDIEVRNLEKIFSKNGYPYDFFHRVVNKFLCKKFENVENSNIDINRKNCLKLPFIGKESVILQKALKKLFLDYFQIDIFCVFTSFKIKNHFSLKCQTPFSLSANVINKFTCLRDAEKFYIRKTSRHLAVRAKEHLDLKIIIIMQL